MDHKLYETYRTIEKKHWWFVGRQKILFDVLKNHLAQSGKILDIGCNTGVLVGMLQEKGYDASGTDLSLDAIAYGEKRGVKNLFVARGERQPFGDASFDCILALDVIEHIDDDKAVVREMKRLLRPGGIIIIKVPAFMFLWSLQDKVAHHKRRYTKKTLSDTIVSQGFTIKRGTYFNFFLFLPIMFSRVIQKIIPPKRSSDFDLNNAFINKVLKSIFVFEAWLLRHFNFPFGVSLLAIAEKK